MPSFVKEANAYINQDAIPCVEIKYKKYVEGQGYIIIPTIFETTTVGGWSDIKSKKNTYRYDDFLDMMIEKTLTVRRHLADIELDNVLCENYNIRSLIRIMNAIKIIDPTFLPPIINRKCTWQKKFIRELCTTTFPSVIQTCRNDKRLDNLFTVLRMIEEEL